MHGDNLVFAHAWMTLRDYADWCRRMLDATERAWERTQALKGRPHAPWERPPQEYLQTAARYANLLLRLRHALRALPVAVELATIPADGGWHLVYGPPDPAIAAVRESAETDADRLYRALAVVRESAKTDAPLIEACADALAKALDTIVSAVPADAPAGALREVFEQCASSGASPYMGFDDDLRREMYRLINEYEQRATPRNAPAPADRRRYVGEVKALAERYCRERGYPGERMLARRLGVNRGTLRKAVQRSTYLARLKTERDCQGRCSVPRKASIDPVEQAHVNDVFNRLVQATEDAAQRAYLNGLPEDARRKLVGILTTNEGRLHRHWRDLLADCMRNNWTGKQTGTGRETPPIS